MDRLDWGLVIGIVLLGWLWRTLAKAPSVYPDRCPRHESDCGGPCHYPPPCKPGEGARGTR